MKKRVLIALIAIFGISLFTGMFFTLMKPVKYANMLSINCEENEELESEKLSNDYIEYSKIEHSGISIEITRITRSEKEDEILGHLRHCPETPPPNMY